MGLVGRGGQWGWGGGDLFFPQSHIRLSNDRPAFATPFFPQSLSLDFLMVEIGPRFFFLLLEAVTSLSWVPALFHFDPNNPPPQL